MSGSVNKVILVGRLGKDPESRAMQSGSKVVSFSMATSESWNDKMSGERKEKTQWHRVVIFNDKLGEIAEKYLKKGSRAYIEGSIESRKYTDKDGQERDITEVVLSRFRGELTLLDSRAESEGGGYTPRAPTPRREEPARSSGPSWEPPGGANDLDDEIPF